MILKKKAIILIIIEDLKTLLIDIYLIAFPLMEF